MCLAGWRDYSAQVSLPNLHCLGQPDAIINCVRVVEQLVPNSFDEFKEEGRLRPVLLAAVASLMMYDREVVAVIGPYRKHLLLHRLLPIKSSKKFLFTHKCYFEVQEKIMTKSLLG